ncbi:TorF family putative porin [Amphritea sp. 1_MG-2023]|uniref:TorF family putative porin n=1 Tax=Amphritea sp. 1_MG-2023 TaxID=3062670 RepID=UPI0026E373B5|nr:TorF family putative porin [Amphritea sp. 1_MG-2023]MDO6563364.1 TorF family putative porin [Amphritea sp. 1_MG-2023]
MKKIFTGLVTAMTLSTAVQAADVSGTVSFTNDYRFHGLSQTMGDPAVQGSLDVGFDNGVYAGIWGSNVDFDDDANLEIDYYVGYGNDINDALSYDVMAAYYTYSGYSGESYDYLELITSLYYGDFAFSYAFADDYANSGDESHYLGVDYSYGINDAVSLDLHAGHSFGDAYSNDYEDYSIGLSGDAAGLDLSVAYLTNDIKGAKTDDYDDDTVVFTVSRTF